MDAIKVLLSSYTCLIIEGEVRKYISYQFLWHISAFVSGERQFHQNKTLFFSAEVMIFCRFWVNSGRICKNLPVHLPSNKLEQVELEKFEKPVEH